MISVLLYGRNDAHGYNLHRRAALSLNCIAELLTDPDDELIFVDYNTPDELPTFIEAISDTLTDHCLARLRVLRVPAAIHEQRFAARTHLPVQNQSRGTWQLDVQIQRTGGSSLPIPTWFSYLFRGRA